MILFLSNHDHQTNTRNLKKIQQSQEESVENMQHSIFKKFNNTYLNYCILLLCVRAPGFGFYSELLKQGPLKHHKIGQMINIKICGENLKAS